MITTEMHTPAKYLFNYGADDDNGQTVMDTGTTTQITTSYSAIAGENHSVISSGHIEDGRDTVKPVAGVWNTAKLFAGPGSRIITDSVVIPNPTRGEQTSMTACKVKFTEDGEKVYIPEGSKPVTVWTEPMCLERLKKSATANELAICFRKSAEWLAETPDGWLSKYRSDCVSKLHETYDKYRQILDQLNQTPKPKVGLFGKKPPAKKGLFGGRK
jgi:hypothetical protein